MKHYIALADCDCFFVSAERAFNRKLEGKPVAVLSHNDGCVVSRSNEAKKLGLKMGEPYFMAKKRLPQIIYVRSNMALYKRTSAKVMAILHDFTPDVEVCSIDEAYLDLTGTKLLYKQNYLQIARTIRQKIWDEVHIPISIGLSDTKTLAKLASDKAKKHNGLFVIGNAKRQKVLLETPIGDICGVGKQLLKTMREHCIFTAMDFVARPDFWINSVFGKHGTDLKKELCGHGLFKVCSEIRNPLSIQQTEALKNFTTDINILKQELCKHIHTICKRAREDGAKGLILEIMLRTKDFKVLTLKENLPFPTNQEMELIPPALRLLEMLYVPTIIWRSCGLTLGKLVYDDAEQFCLFGKSEKSDERLGKALDKLEEKFGQNIVHFSAKSN